MVKKKTAAIYILVILGSTFLGAFAGIVSAYLGSAPSLDQVNIPDPVAQELNMLKKRIAELEEKVK